MPKEEFKATAALITYWDGKILGDMMGKEVVDNFQILGKLILI